MDTSHLKALIVTMEAERDALSRAIQALIRVVDGAQRAEKAPPVAKRKKRVRSPEYSAKISAAMKAAHARRKAAGLAWAPNGRVPVADFPKTDDTAVAQ
jgi:hypothetical protein